MSQNTERRQYRVTIVYYATLPSGEIIVTQNHEPFGPFFTLASVNRLIRKADERIEIANRLAYEQTSATHHWLRTDVQYRDPDWCDYRPGLTPGS